MPAMARVARFTLRRRVVTRYYENIFLNSIFRQSGVTSSTYHSSSEDTAQRVGALSRPPLVTSGQRRLAILFLSFFFPQTAGTTTSSDRAPIVEALGWVRTAPRNVTEFDYVMTARVRLLFFWAGKDDVGGGYIRRGVSKEDPKQELLQVLFGSDPAKAPRAINRWGAGTEVIWHKAPVVDDSKDDDVVASAFFGFMKSSKGKSVSEMQEELKKEKAGGAHQFTGILSRVESGHAISLVVPLASDEDYNLHQYDLAEPVMLDRLAASDRPARVLHGGAGCSGAEEFLGAVSRLTDAAIEGRPAPRSRCYIYDAQINTLTLERLEPVANFDVKVNAVKGGTLIENSYHDLLQAEFVSTHQATGKKVNFTILLGTQGAMKGVPVQIRYQPNWWFQVVLNWRPNA
jgi:hypothetical protein